MFNGIVIEALNMYGCVYQSTKVTSNTLSFSSISGDKNGTKTHLLPIADLREDWEEVLTEAYAKNYYWVDVSKPKVNKQ